MDLPVPEATGAYVVDDPVPGAPSALGQTMSTIEEPVSTTILRDLMAIARKVRLVLFPIAETETELKNWDLWGPLVFCLALAVVLAIGSKVGNARSGHISRCVTSLAYVSLHSSPIFAGVFAFVWIGSGVVTLNAKFLGGRLSFFQIVCVLGYSMFPLVVVALVCGLLSIFWVVKLAIAAVATGWSVWAARAFFVGCVREQRRALVMYPVFLFYFFIAWLIVVSL